MRRELKVLAVGIMCAVMSISLMSHEALAVSVEPDMGINPIVNVGANSTVISVGTSALEDAASAEVDKWQKEVDAATSNITVLTKQLEEYTKIVKQKETSLSEAEAVVALGSYGYFQYKESADAMNILKGENVKSSYLRGSTAPSGFIGYTHIGQTDDATSLLNMKRSLAWIKECNEIRASEGLNACTVNDVAMAMAQTDANYSSNVWGHAKYYFIAENIAKGYVIECGDTSGIGGPFAGWYTKEKTLYQQNVSKYDGASSMSSYELSQKYPNFYQQVGHYLNIIVEGTPVTGLAVNSEAFVHAQEFDSYGRTGKGLDVETYEKDFLTYYDKVTAEVMKAESELSEAKVNVTDTEAKKTAAQNVLASAAASLAKAKEAYEKAKNTITDSAGKTNYTFDAKTSDNSTADKVSYNGETGSDTKTQFSIKNKAKVKATSKIKVTDKDKIKTITLNGKKIKIKKNKTSITLKLKSYKKLLKKKGKWNKLVVTDIAGKKVTLKFKIK
ncbi:MAG: hypothetical protein IJ232_03850 [Lachnospiraceae bacterium]|nr:hypothetical protein [Lachnospiraceae bacterium]